MKRKWWWSKRRWHLEQMSRLYVCVLFDGKLFWHIRMMDLHFNVLYQGGRCSVTLSPRTDSQIEVTVGEFS